MIDARSPPPRISLPASQIVDVTTTTAEKVAIAPIRENAPSVRTIIVRAMIIAFGLSNVVTTKCCKRTTLPSLARTLIQSLIARYKVEKAPNLARKRLDAELAQVAQ